MNQSTDNIIRVLTIVVMLLSVQIMTGCGMSAVTPALPENAESAASSLRSSAVDQTNHSLAGTKWQLLEIQSMDDAIGTVRPKDPSLFTMRLKVDGTVTMRLDCNRANGTWTSEPAADGLSGRFEFGSLAATGALCPPPNLDERILAQARYVRGYLLRDGRLYLSLMADGGIFAWEPIEDSTAFETESDAELEAAILQASPDYNRKIVEVGKQEARYLYSRFDLNGDGRQEVFAYLLGSIFCGTGGCNLLLFTDNEGRYSLVNSFPISRVPVIVSKEKTTGWNDLIRLESGGGLEASYVRHTFDGSNYVERERLPADSPPLGTEVLTGEFTFHDGIPLSPRN